MLITHETPLDMMYTIQQYTDYDYCLVHLLEKSEEYVEYFVNAKNSGRLIIMDCSLYELGTSFDSKKYAQWIEKINPTEYIVPDVWQNYEENIKSFKSFASEYKNLPGKKLGVLQGKTTEELINAYQFMNSEADKICVSFGYNYYLNLFNKHIPIKYAESDLNVKFNPLSFSCGRIFLINFLLSIGILNKNKPHHLLGCGSPLEFCNYVNYDFITSADTSHPVLMGLENKKYTDPNMDFYKPSFKIDDIFFNETGETESFNVIDNVIYFKKFLCK